jgi:hypothetical protein
MSAVLGLVRDELIAGGYAVGTADDQDGPVLLFESDSILGFVLCFPDASALLERWQPSSQRVLQAAQFALRRAERKAWNTYLVFLTEAAGDYGQNILLGAIEEDLVGTRKIARAGINGIEEVHAAMLPLLAIQNAPGLDAVDMAAEIRLRTTELPGELVDAFLSGASDATLAQMLEVGQ